MSNGEFTMRSRKGFAIIRRYECVACAALKANMEKYQDMVVPEIFVANATKTIRTNPDRPFNGGHFCDRDLYKVGKRGGSRDDFRLRAIHRANS